MRPPLGVLALAALASASPPRLRRHPKPAPAAVLGRRGRDRRPPGRASRATRHVARARPALPATDRPLRGPAERGDDGEPRRAAPGRGARPGARGGADPRASPRHPDRAQGQHPHHRHADDGRCSRVRRPGPALRGDAHEEPPRRGGDHPRQDGAHRARQLGGRPAGADAGELQRARRLRLQPLRPAARPARGDLRRPPRALDRRLELRHRHGGELLGRERGHRDLGLDPEPGEPEHAGRDQAHGRPREPLRRHPDHGRPGHARPAGAQRAGRRDPARRPRGRSARSPGRGHEDLRSPARARLHEAPRCGRAQGRADRHSARLLLRQDDTPGCHGAARRTEPRPGEEHGRGDRDPAGAGRRGRGSRRHPERRREGRAPQLPALGHLRRRGRRQGQRRRRARSSSSTA